MRSNIYLQVRAEADEPRQILDATRKLASQRTGVRSAASVPRGKQLASLPFKLNVASAKSSTCPSKTFEQPNRSPATSQNQQPWPPLPPAPFLAPPPAWAAPLPAWGQAPTVRLKERGVMRAGKWVQAGGRRRRLPKPTAPACAMPPASLPTAPCSQDHPDRQKRAQHARQGLAGQVRPLLVSGKGGRVSARKRTPRCRLLAAGRLISVSNSTPLSALPLFTPMPPCSVIRLADAEIQTHRGFGPG